MIFYVGIFEAHKTHFVENACISINVLTRTKKGHSPPKPRKGWILDSGAFTQIAKYGAFKMSESKYADYIARYFSAGESGLYGGPLKAAVTQDYVCNKSAYYKTGLNRGAHQDETVKRYDRIKAELKKRSCNAYLMPVLQGEKPEDYAAHLEKYGDRIAAGDWVGIGSIQPLSQKPRKLFGILDAVKKERPDLKLHGFGVKLKALNHYEIYAALYSCDSMAWSFRAWRESRSSHDINEAIQYENEVKQLCYRHKRTQTLY